MNRAIYKFLRFSGIPFIIRETIQKRKITIVVFHDPLVDTFESTIKYLKKNYNIIPLIHYVESLKGFRSLPAKSIIITLDDGHKNNFKLMRIIKEYHVPVTIFLCSEIVGTNRHFWWTHKLDQYNLKQLKKMEELERKKLYKKYNFDYLADFGEENRQTLSMEEVCEMLSSGYVDFQSHTMFHAILDRCDNTLAYNEIESSKKSLEKKLNINIYALAYPNGIYSDREITFAQKSGYKCALTTEPGFNDIKTNPFKLKRLSIRNQANLDEIKVRASGLWGFFKKTKKLLFSSTID